MKLLVLLAMSLVLVSCVAGRREWDYSTRGRWVVAPARSLGYNGAGCTEYKLMEPYGKYYSGHSKVKSYVDCRFGHLPCPSWSKANLFLEEMSNGAFVLRKVECFTEAK